MAMIIYHFQNKKANEVADLFEHGTFEVPKNPDKFWISNLDDRRLICNGHPGLRFRIDLAARKAGVAIERVEIFPDPDMESGGDVWLLLTLGNDTHGNGFVVIRGIYSNDREAEAAMEGIRQREPSTDCFGILGCPSGEPIETEIGGGYTPENGFSGCPFFGDKVRKYIYYS